ncbi:hypothetical protein [Thalassotalea mangrovi]|uniref:Uncharacterized protein n=1 Tax=Thalassotalea mangrovi TaxID=2572245 RepID=A0A4U1B2D6_9GAMM|nr:hypothetical protein [Thalassotalea mangrovi]TKB43561.1 hypothetical protein E8M12_14800 [Thalassotalea mangrovi]
MDIHIIFTKSKVVISKTQYLSWRDIQSDFSDYMASLGPWDEEAAIDWLEMEYENLIPSAREQIKSLIASEDLENTITFA